MQTNTQIRTRHIGGLLLLLLGLWVLHSYLALLAWAVVLAITTWPVYLRLLNNSKLHGHVVWASVFLTLLIGAMILVPLGYGLGRLLQESESLAQIISETQKVGIPAPTWLETIPGIGQWMKELWTDFLGTAEAAKESLHSIGNGGAIKFTKDFASQIVQRFMGFLTTLLVLFFVYCHGESLGQQVLATSRKLFGDIGVRYVIHATAAVRATVNGLVLVGIGKGLLLGVAYAMAGLSHPAILGAITGAFAMIPYAAKLIFGSCSLVLIADGHIAEGSALFVFGFVVTLIADNYVRPALIGGAVQLPFLCTLLGIFGGMENFGLLGVFLGPSLMAVLMSIWRDWIEDISNPVANDYKA